MPSSHLPGGLKSPTRQSRSSDGAPPRHCTGGFTPPVDALRHGRSRKPFTICSYEKCARKSLAMCTYKLLDLKVFGISSYRKPGGVPPPCFPACDVFVCLFALNNDVAGLFRCRPWAWVRGSDYQVLSARARKKQHAAAWGNASHAAPRLAKKRPGGTDFPPSLASNGKGRSREKCGSRCEL